MTINCEFCIKSAMGIITSNDVK